MEIVRNGFANWADELSDAGHTVSFHFVEVSFAKERNKEEKDKLNEIGTNFSLSNEEVDLLIGSGRRILRHSTEFQDFLNENKGNLTASGLSSATDTL